MYIFYLNVFTVIHKFNLILPIYNINVNLEDKCDRHVMLLIYHHDIFQYKYNVH